MSARSRRRRAAALPAPGPGPRRRAAIGLALGLAALAASAGSAPAATLTESAQPGGLFSGLWARPTSVGAGFDRIEGMGAQNAFDNFVFAALPPGAQRITFDFAAPAAAGQSYSAGGQILWSEAPFRWGWDGRNAGTVQVDHRRPAQSLTLDLAESFGGTLYLALNFTHGRDLSYRISAPSNAAGAPAPVPLPAAVWLLGAGMAALGALGWRRRAAAA